MKRGLVALILFITCVVFSVYCTEKSKSALKNAEYNINEIRILCENGDNVSALDKAESFKEKWDRSHFILKISVDRGAVKEIEAAVISLPYLIKNGNTQKASEQCETAVYEIEYLLDGEKLKWENIF